MCDGTARAAAVLGDVHEPGRGMPVYLIGLRRALRCREKLIAALNGLPPDLTTDPRVRAFLAPAGAEWDKLDELA